MRQKPTQSNNIVVHPAIVYNIRSIVIHIILVFIIYNIKKRIMKQQTLSTFHHFPYLQKCRIYSFVSSLGSFLLYFISSKTVEVLLLWLPKRSQYNNENTNIITSSSNSNSLITQNTSHFGRFSTVGY